MTLVRNGKSFTTEYTQGCYHRIWVKTDVFDGRFARYKLLVGKAGTPVGHVQGNKTVLQVEALEKYTAPTLPTLTGVLFCLVTDVSGVADGKSFEEWAEEYGYDIDSRKAEKAFNTCVEEWRGLIRLGADLKALNEWTIDWRNI